MTPQTTLSRVITRAGVALHSGAQVSVRLCPAEPNTGIVFSVDGVAVPATLSHVVDTQLATTVGIGTARVRTIEHLLAACVGAGLDNTVVSVSGGEIPVLDGCAAAWLDAIDSSGLVEQAMPRREAVILRPFEIKDGPRWARLLPAEETVLDVRIDFDHPGVGQ